MSDRQGEGMNLNSADETFLDTQTDEYLCRLAKDDLLAEEILIKRYSKLVKSCARPYFIIGADFEDLLQEGLLGLLKAIKRFDNDKGVSFSAFAKTCILNSIYNAVKSANSSKHIPLNSYISIEKPLFDDKNEGLMIEYLSLYDPESLVIDREEQMENTKKLMETLSTFEARILELYLSGMSTKEMAELLSKKFKSIDNAVKRIKEKAAKLFPLDD